ncbi:MAG: S49 family peptidase [Acidobacteria bacterium]|nr:S49 family peptidase [Acidobacteriota bacterium]
MTQFASLRRAMNGRLWYVHEQKMHEIMAFLEMRLSGGHAAEETIAAIRAANEASELRAKSAAAAGGGTVAVIPVYGVIMHRPSMDLSGPGGTSCTVLSRRIREAVNDPNISAIVMDVDSPGGDTDGVDELATEIYNARKQKKITAVSNCLMASAAYYLASQASEVVVSPSSMTGSIGVYCVHEDDSEMLTKLGVKLSLIKFGENKAEGNPYEPLTDVARGHLQEMVDTFGAMFERAVARGRNVSREEVHSKFGQGRVFDAKTAVKIGMADRVGTLDDVLSKYGVVTSSSSARAEAEVPEIQAEAPVADVAADARRRQLALAAI